MFLIIYLILLYKVISVTSDCSSNKIMAITKTHTSTKPTTTTNKTQSSTKPTTTTQTSTKQTTTQATTTTTQDTKQTTTTTTTTQTTKITTNTRTNTLTTTTASNNNIQNIPNTLDINDIIKYHNIERNLKNVNNIEWNDLLRNNAQLTSNRLANEFNCRLEHILYSGSSGQNLYAGYGWITPNFTESVFAWINEKNSLDIPGIPWVEIGHYLIIVSSGFTKVGCGSSININKNCFVVACDYS